MASDSILDFDRLLRPISDDNPCGADLRWEDTYQQIKDARPKQDRDAFGLDEVTVGEWPPVIELTSDALAERSKDLMLSAWLTESLVQVHGFAGLRDGLKLINGLIETFWDGLYPLPDGDDLEPRAAPLVFLTTEGSGARLPDTLKDVPLTPDRDEAFSWNYWRARQPMPKETSEKFALRSEEVQEKIAKFDGAVARMSLDAARKVYEDVQAAQQELARFDKILDERFKDVAPGTSGLRASLQECFVRVRAIYKEKGGFAESGSDAADDEGASASSNGQSTGSVGPIRTREDAFRRLAEVAAFLKLKEPQSPIYLLVERAVTWSRLPFDQLLSELIKDAGARHQVGELLGIKSPDGGSEGS